MALSRYERLAPLTGIAFVVLTVVGVLIATKDSPDDFPGEVQQIVEYYTDGKDSIITGSWIAIVGVLFLFWFAGSLRERLGFAEGGAGRLASVAFGGGVAAATILLVFNAVNLIGALRVEEHDEIAPETATALSDASNGLIGTALPVAMAAMIGAAGVVAIRTGALPRWLGIVSLVLMVGLLILPIAWILLLPALLWVLVVSVLLYTRPAAPVAGPGTTGAPPPARTTPA